MTSLIRNAVWTLGLVAVVATPVVAQVSINEIRIDQPSTDSDEYFELAGGAGTDLTGMTYLVIGDGAGGSGTIEAVVDLTGSALGAGGFFVAAESSFTLGSADLTTSLNFENSDNVTHLLVDGFVGANADDLDTNDDGTLDSTPWSSLVDCIGLVETVGSGDLIYCADTVGPDGTFVPGHALDCPGGFQIGAFNPVGGNDTPGAANDCAQVSVSISEVRIDQPSTDNDEYFELAGNSGDALDGLTYLVIGDGSGGSGVVEAVVDLAGSSVPGSGLFVAAESTFTIGLADLTTSLNFENSDNVTHLVVRDFTGANGDDLDGDDDGALDAPPWSELVDCIGLIETVGSGDLVYCADTVGPDGIFVPGHAIDCPGGFQIGAFDPVGGNDTPGAANDCAPPSGGGAVVINEIDYDQPGADFAEFVELRNNDAADVSLSGFSLELVNGTGGGASIYQTINLPAVTLAPGEYFVVCSNFATVLACDLDAVSSIQNGSPDAVGLRFGGAIVDTVSYEGDTGAPYSEGSGSGLTDPGTGGVGGGNDNKGISRFPDGADTDVNNVDLSTRCITPGAANSAESGNCAAPGPPSLVVNEIDYDQPGADFAEFVEIKNVGAGAASLSGVELVLVNGATGSPYGTFALPSVTLAAGDYFVVCTNAATVANCDLAVLSSIQNGSPDAVALSFAGSILDTVSYEGNTAAPYTEGSGSGLTDSGSSGQDNKGISRFPDGVDTDVNNIDLTFVCITPGGANTDRTTNCSPTGPVLEIWEIQGAGFSSPFDGSVVNTADNVVTCLSTNGFFMQTPTSRTDGDVATSDGIFVFTGGAPGVAVGDLVDVSGAVDEFFGFTEFAGGSTVAVTGNDPGQVPAAVVFDATVPSPDPTTPSCGLFEFECYEGMLIDITDGTVTGPNQRFGTDPIAEVHITAAPARTFREPGVEFPGLGMPPIPTWDGNPEVFELDPDKLGLPNQIIPAGSSFSASGVLGFEFGGYELWPNSLVVDPAPLPVAVRLRNPGEFTIASLNLFRLFDDVDDPPSMAADGRERDDFVVSTAEYLRRRAKFAVYVLDVLDAPDVLAIQEAEKLGVLEDLAADITALEPTVVYNAFLEEGNDLGTIDVGFLVRDTIQVDAVTQLGKFETFVNPITLEDNILHDRPPLLLEARFSAQDDDDSDSDSDSDSDAFKFEVLGVHNRSLGGIEGSEALRVKIKRLEQALYIVEQADLRQGKKGKVRFMVTGDFNAFEFTDGFVDAVGTIKGDFDPTENEFSGPDLVEPDLSNVVDTVIPAGERYSFIFRGNAQVLDHALVSAKLDKFVRGAEYGRGNADAAVDLINDGSTVLRASDHDGLVVFIQSDPDEFEDDDDSDSDSG
ncbi:MAG: lamin tail domain-containing protein [Thermoanaerobaculia bacterium]